MAGRSWTLPGHRTVFGRSTAEDRSGRVFCSEAIARSRSAAGKKRGHDGFVRAGAVHRSDASAGDRAQRRTVADLTQRRIGRAREGDLVPGAAQLDGFAFTSGSECRRSTWRSRPAHVYRRRDRRGVAAHQSRHRRSLRLADPGQVESRLRRLYANCGRATEQGDDERLLGELNPADCRKHCAPRRRRAVVFIVTRSRPRMKQ